MSRHLQLIEEAFVEGELADAGERERALDMASNVIAKAPAGSGKTGLLVKRYLKSLALCEHPEQVLAMTFTRKAAGEMRDRVMAALRDKKSTDPIVLAAQRRNAELSWGLDSNPHRVRAMTIDSLCGQLAAQTPLLSKLGGAGAVADDPNQLYDRAIFRLLGDLESADLSDEDAQSLRAVLGMANNRMDKLIKPLRALLQRREQWLPLLVANGQSGDLDRPVLERLIERGLRQMDEVLPAYVRAELPGIAVAGSDAGIDFGFEPAGEWPKLVPDSLAQWSGLARMLVTKDLKKIKSRVDARNGFPAKAAHTDAMKALLKDLNADPVAAEALRDACKSVATLPDLEIPATMTELRAHLNRALLRLAAHLQVVMTEMALVDHVEIASRALMALDDGAGFSDLLGRLDYEIRHLLVDEMQDTSRLQLALVRMLTSGWERGDGRTLFVVGDPMQSIYKFRQAEVRIFLDLWERKAVGDLPLERVQLSANFRSQPGIVEFANRVFGRVFPEVADPLVGVVPRAEAEPRLRPLSDWLGETTDEEGAQFLPYVGPNAVQLEVASVVAAVRRTLAAQQDRTVAVLARSRSHLTPIIEGLKEAGVAFQATDIDPLGARDEVRDLMALARALWHPLDDQAWTSLLRSPLVGLRFSDMIALRVSQPKGTWRARVSSASGMTLSADGKARCARLIDVLRTVESDEEVRYFLPAKVDAAWHLLGGPAAIRGPVALKNVRSALSVLERHCEGGQVDDLSSVSEELGRVYAAPDLGQVHLMTIHGSKGLEFDYVHLVGVGRRPRNDDKPLMHFVSTDDGVLFAPKPKDSLDKAGAEWRLFDFLHRFHATASKAEAARLLYVAATRAGIGLQVHATFGWDAKREEMTVEPGALLGELEPAMDLLLGDYAGRDWSDDVRSAGVAVAERPEVPCTYQLPADWQFSLTGYQSYKPAEKSIRKPSEAVLHGHEASAATGTMFGRLVGTMYHEAMERIASDGIDAWSDYGESRRTALIAGFRRLGLPEPQVPDAVVRVLWLVKQTLTCKIGQRILAPREWARDEYRLAGFFGGEWVSAVVDRCFIDDKNVLWVIDYKSDDANDEEALDAYRGQVRQYADILQRKLGSRISGVRGGLYFPATQQLVEVDCMAEPA